MKRLISLLLLVLIIVSFTGCAEKITMDNIENVETEHQYSRVVLGKYLVKTDETKIVVDAKEFAKNLYLSSKTELITKIQILKMKK